MPFTLGICLLDLLCLLWASPIVPRPDSRGCILSLPASFRLRVPSAPACHSLSIPLQHTLDWEQRERDRPWEDQDGRDTGKLSTLPRLHQSLGHLTLTFTVPAGHILRYWCLYRNHLSHLRSLLPKAILLLHHPIPHPHYWVIGPGWTLGPELFP